MSRLQWNVEGSKRFETGCDRGVLYLPDGSGVPWNGLTNVTDDNGGVVVEEYYLDGVKYMDYRSPGSYGGTLKALMYPEEFLPFDGFAEFEEGLSASNQAVLDVFGLSYRTRMGNDSSGIDYGYKLHLLYNLTALPDAKTFGTLTNTTSGAEFSWTLSGVPIQVPGLRPTCHLIIDSTSVAPGGMTLIENYLYGVDDTDGMLPDATTLASMLEGLVDPDDGSI